MHLAQKVWPQSTTPESGEIGSRQITQFEGFSVSIKTKRQNAGLIEIFSKRFDLQSLKGSQKIIKDRKLHKSHAILTFI